MSVLEKCGRRLSAATYNACVYFYFLTWNAEIREITDLATFVNVHEHLHPYMVNIRMYDLQLV